jgi:ribosomal protein S25
MKAKRVSKKSAWQEVDVRAVMGAKAEQVWKSLYQATVKTAAQLAQESGLDLSVTQQAIDELVQQGKIRCIKETPDQAEPGYTMPIPAGQGIITYDEAIRVAADVVWHCLGKNGRLTYEVIQQETGLNMRYTAMAVGYLAAGNRLKMFENTRTKEEAFCLTAAQQKIYRKKGTQGGLASDLTNACVQII